MFVRYLPEVEHLYSYETMAVKVSSDVPILEESHQYVHLYCLYMFYLFCLFVSFQEYLRKILMLLSLVWLLNVLIMLT